MNEKEWWGKYAKFPTVESDGQSIPLCLVPDLIAETQRLERERIRGIGKETKEMYSNSYGVNEIVDFILSKLTNE